MANLDEATLEGVAFLGNTLGPFFLQDPRTGLAGAEFAAVAALDAQAAGAEWPFADEAEATRDLAMMVEGLAATHALAAEGIPVNMTLCFSVPQAILAARAGARYISPFIGRFDDISEDGLDQVANIVTALNNYDFTSNTVNGEQVEVIAASIRSANHVTQAALMGADIATVPFGVLKKMVQHPLTDRGLEAFLKDWEKVQNA